MSRSPETERNALARIFLTPGERRLRAGWRLAAQLSLFFTLLLVLALPASLILAFLPMQTISPGGSPTQSEFILASGLQILAVVVSIFIARRWIDRRSFTSLGLSWNRKAARDLLFGIGLSGVMIATIFAIELGAGWLQFEGFAWTGRSALSVIGQLLLMLVVFVLVGWYEEMFFRGYWLINLIEGLNTGWGVAITSAFFALVHAANPNANRAAMVGLTLAGIFFAYAALSSKALWLPIGLHIGWNFFEGTVFGFQVSGLDTQIFQLIQQRVAGPDLWTGGAFGPEAGLVLLPGLALGAAGIYLYTRGDRSEDIHDEQRGKPPSS
jgi:membrane protease YdiL (CAAX protease family)